jgi:hypothetical protein
VVGKQFYGNNYWLIQQIAGKANVKSVREVGIAVEFVTDGGTYVVYTPNSDEYRVTADVIDQAKEAGATMVSYSTAWCGNTDEGKARGREIGVLVMPHGAFFSRIDRL